MNDVVLAIDAWASNGKMIEDVAKLKYMDGTVLDVTFGYGNFWTHFKPRTFIGADINLHKTPHLCADFRSLPFHAGSVDSVVFDPPYKLNGTPDPFLDERYGIHERKTIGQRLDLIVDGAIECARVARQYLLVKCQDQVCSGKVVWQTDIVTLALTEIGMRKKDRIDILSYRPQPSYVRQLHARRNSSTLLVFTWQ